MPDDAGGQAAPQQAETTQQQSVVETTQRQVDDGAQRGYIEVSTNEPKVVDKPLKPRMPLADPGTSTTEPPRPAEAKPEK